MKTANKRILGSIASLGLAVLVVGNFIIKYNEKEIVDAGMNAAAEAVYDIDRNIRYSFTVQNPTHLVMRDVDFYTYAPVKTSSNQYCCTRLDVSQSHVIEKDAMQNQVVHVHYDLLPPFTTKIVNVDATIQLANAANALEENDLARYLNSEPLAPLNDPTIKTLAKQLAKETTEATMRSIYQWLVSNIEYSGYDRDDRGASYAVAMRKGDCTEFMYLLIALARENGIPARGVAGYVYNGDAVLKPKDHHNWAEFYMDGAWHIADAQKQIFMQQHSSFIGMRVILDSETQAISNAHRFWYNNPALKVRMN